VDLSVQLELGTIEKQLLTLFTFVLLVGSIVNSFNVLRDVFGAGELTGADWTL